MYPAVSERLVVGITAASGVIYGIRLPEALQRTQVEAHLVLSKAARVTIAQETEYKVSRVEALAHVSYSPDDIGAAIATSYSADVLARAADMTLKEGRPLVLAVRETPPPLGHLRPMAQAAEAGAVIMPPLPAFYSHPRTIQDTVDQTVGRVLARLGTESDLLKVWNGL